MNLLTDPWIPIQQNQQVKLITLESLLCGTETPDKIALSRDDMELACLQLLICLIQVLFLPKDKEALIQCITSPLTPEAYQKGIQDYLEWFDLAHPTMPFMQIRGVKSAKPTPVQKLFIGLPAGNNHAFFNNPGEIQQTSLSASAIALFNQAMNSPSFGGGFKGGFRGGAPVTTLVSANFMQDDEVTHNALRETLWFNVLHQETIEDLIPNYQQLKTQDKPTWVEPIKKGSTISADNIGLLRGLFWQPAHIELNFNPLENNHCDFYGISIDKPCVINFNMEKFVYTIVGDWHHPHSPRILDLKKKQWRYRSFTTPAPTWTQYNHLIFSSETKKETYQRATVIEQFQSLIDSNDFHFQLMIGGYRNKQASILQRKHELFPLATGWDQYQGELIKFIETALDIKNQLRQKLYGFAKTIGVEGLSNNAEQQFYHQGESIILDLLQQFGQQDNAVLLQCLKDKLIKLAWQIFNEQTEPYQYNAKSLKARVVAQRNLSQQFKKIKGETNG